MAKANKTAASIVPLKLQAKSIFLAGNFYHQNEAVSNLIKLEGGKTVDELTEKTDMVILGHSAVANPQKKAAKLNAQGAAIQVLSFDQFQQQIKPTPDEAVKLLLSGPKGIERWNRHGLLHPQFGYFVHPQHRAKSRYIENADFSDADLTNANLSDQVYQSSFVGANLTGCQLNLANCQLKGANLNGVKDLYLVDCTAENCDFSRIAATVIRVDASNLSGSRFTNAKQLIVQIQESQLDGADFSKLHGPQSVFQSCSMKNARFAGANVEEANFAGSDLSGADFTNANLKLAKFTDVKVDGADFTGATMVGADVAVVDFSKAKGFDAAQTKAAGGAGPAVQNFLQIASQAQRVSTSLTVSQGAQEATLTIDIYPQWVNARDSAGNSYPYTIKPTRASSAALWAKMATKWHGAVPELASVKVNANKAPKPNKELKELALHAWCELFGVEPLSNEDLKQAAVAREAQKREKTEEGLRLLRTGKKGVQQWNDNYVALSKMLYDIAGVDLANTKLAGLKLGSMNWKNANLSGADLAKAEMPSCRFPGGNFAGANLKGAKLVGSNFHDANLQNADATSAEVWSATFKRANCKGMKLAKAKLNGADMCGADLTGADLSDADLTGVSYDENTRWPKGFTPTLDMIWKGPGTSPAAHKLVQSTKPKGMLNIEQFMKRLEELTDAAKLAKALAMLKADRFRLYAQVKDDRFVGVVKSQTSADLVYSCRLNADGTYACCTQNLNICGGLRGSLCKHLLVLIVGLAKNGELDPHAIDTWIRLSKTNKPALDKDAMSETFLRYKGAEAGEVDWRPTETIPEDYYAM